MLRKLPTSGDKLFERVSAWIAPWGIRGYPGKGRILTSVVGFRITYNAMSQWRQPGRRVPQWAARMFAEHIRAQCEAGMALADELEHHATALEAIPHHLSAAGRMAHARAARRPGSAMGARAKQLPVVSKEKSP